MRCSGSVKFFNDIRGYGFLCPEDGGEEVFVHRTDLGRSCAQKVDGMTKFILYPDQRVSYELQDSNNGKGTGKKAAKVELSA